MNFFKNIQWLPYSYSEASVIAPRLGEEMLSRLSWMTLKPKVVLDIGCGTGDVSILLKTHYKDATFFAIDLSESMLAAAKQAMSKDQTYPLICADGAHLPFGDQSVDLIFANLLLPWHVSIKNLLREWRRLLRPQGLLIFTALGIDTMQEWKETFDVCEMPSLIDMHDLGDLLMEEGFADPVLDVDYYTLSYRDKKHLLHELIATGMWFPPTDHKRQEIVLNELPKDQQTWEVTYEVIYGHAFIPEKSEANQVSLDGTVRLSLNTVKQQLKKNTNKG